MPLVSHLAILRGVVGCVGDALVRSPLVVDTLHATQFVRTLLELLRAHSRLRHVVLDADQPVASRPS